MSQNTLDIETDEWPEPKVLLIPAREMKPHEFAPNRELAGLYCRCNLPRWNRIHEEVPQ